MPSSRWFLVLLLLCLIGVGAAWYLLSGPRVVLYCAQDQEFALEVLEEFRHQTGLRVTPKFDTEADKSVSLYLELVKEKDRPRCDVFWNNEILSTIRLQRQGLLQPYASPSAKALRPFPKSAESGDGTWHAFATRARVLLVSTKLLPKEDWPKSLLDLTKDRYKGKVVMARPQFGTSATQAACLFEVLGKEKAEQYYRDLRANQVQIAPGNKQVAEWIGQGQTPAGQQVVVGITDTADAMDEIRAKRDVKMLYPDRDAPAESRMGTLFIPNTVAILKDCPHPDGARQLVDYLLSPAVEKKLAEADSHQVPFNPEVKAKLPPEIETPPAVKVMQVDFFKAADLWEQVQTFLRNEFAR
jgi:iron(III) transport system substrate-binding protein